MCPGPRRDRGRVSGSTRIACAAAWCAVSPTAPKFIFAPIAGVTKFDAAFGVVTVLAEKMWGALLFWSFLVRALFY